MFLKQLDLGIHFLLLFDIEGVPPRPKLIRELDFPFHGVNIACMEYTVKRLIRRVGRPALFQWKSDGGCRSSTSLGSGGGYPAGFAGAGFPSRALFPIPGTLGYFRFLTVEISLALSPATPL